MKECGAVRFGVLAVLLGMGAALTIRGMDADPSAAAVERIPASRRSRPSRRTATLHWVHATESRTQWRSATLDPQGLVDGAPTTVELADTGGQPVAPADIAVSRRGDVVIALPLEYEVRIYRPGVEEPVRVRTSDADQPHGIAIDRRGRTAYVVARTEEAPGARLYAVSLARPPAVAYPIGSWPALENATGLEIHRRRLYVACSGLDGVLETDEAVVASCRIETPNEIRSFVVGQGQGYGVAVDPRRRLLHFTVSGEDSVYTVRLADPTPTIAAATLTLPGRTAGVSYDAIHRRIVVGLGIEATESWTGIHSSRVLEPGCAAETTQLLMTDPVRATCTGR